MCYVINDYENLRNFCTSEHIMHVKIKNKIPHTIEKIV